MCKTQNFYILLAFLLTTIASSIAVSSYGYLIKFRVKQKHLLLFQATNNKYIDIINHTYCFFDIINIKHFDPNKIKIDEKSYKNIFTYYIVYVTIKDSGYLKVNSVNPLYRIINKVNEYFEEINKNKYLTLISSIESKETINKYQELWSKIRDLISSITKNSYYYEQKYMHIKLNSDDKLPLNKTIQMDTMIIVVRAVFHENNKYYA